LKKLLNKLSESILEKAGGKSGRSADQPQRLFIHIPKTAGTSFRTAAESSFGEAHVLRDYGPESEATSASVKREVYDADDTKGVLRAFEADHAVLLAGHFPVQKYGRLIGLQNTVTFFRDPIEQVISHYRHAVAHHGYKDTLLTFSKRKGIRNIQTRFMCSLDPALIGIVGLTECYRDSLALINERWNWKIRYRRQNVRDRFNRQGIELSENERTALEDINQDDRRLYQRASRVFKNSLYCFQKRTASDPRGAIESLVIGENIEGWAIDLRSGKPVSVILSVNGKRVAQTDCSHPFKKLMHWNLPCEGEAGFVFEENISAGDAVEIKDAATGLVLDSRVISPKYLSNQPGTKSD